jgi:hypothetical protein
MVNVAFPVFAIVNVSVGWPPTWTLPNARFPLSAMMRVGPAGGDDGADGDELPQAAQPIKKDTVRNFFIRFKREHGGGRADGASTSMVQACTFIRNGKDVLAKLHHESKELKTYPAERALSASLSGSWLGSKNSERCRRSTVKSTAGWWLSNHSETALPPSCRSGCLSGVARRTGWEFLTMQDVQRITNGNPRSGD